MAQSAISLSTAALQKYIHQNNHGFVKGQVISFNGAVYAKAVASSLAGCQGVLMVSSVVDANNFYATQTGYVFNLPVARAPGLQWYVDPVNPGLLTNVMPTGIGQVILPCFVSTSSFEGWFYTGSGTLIEPAILFNWVPVSVNTTVIPNQGYAAAGNIDLTLPLSIPFGAVIKYANLGFTFNVKQQAGQTIQYGNTITTAGVTGQLTSNTIGDSFELLCINVNQGFQVITSMGSNLTVT